MTEVEFSRLLSDLTSNAKLLNEKSNSINDVVKALEEKLRQINLGLTVWLSDDPLSTEEFLEEDHEGTMQATGTFNDELGFSKSASGEWRLAVQEARYKYEVDSWNNREVIFQSASDERSLESCSRDTRIEATKRFPALVQLMNARAKAAIDAIEAAKKLVVK